MLTLGKQNFICMPNKLHDSDYTVISCTSYAPSAEFPCSLHMLHPTLTRNNVSNTRLTLIFYSIRFKHEFNHTFRIIKLKLVFKY